MSDIHAQWQDILERDDRNSPSEYPDMALITFDEFASAVAAERARCAALAISFVKVLPESEHKCAALIMRLVEAMEKG